MAAFLNIDLPLLLAQDQQTSPFGSMLPLMLGAMMLVYFFVVLRPQQSKQKAYQNFLDNLKENDQVVTIGGLYGTVTNVQREAKRVTLRIDDASGARVRVAMWAISHLASEEKEAPTSDADDKQATGKTSGVAKKQSK